MTAVVSEVAALLDAAAGRGRDAYENIYAKCWHLSRKVERKEVKLPQRRKPRRSGPRFWSDDVIAARLSERDAKAVAIRKMRDAGIGRDAARTRLRMATSTFARICDDYGIAGGWVDPRQSALADRIKRFGAIIGEMHAAGATSAETAKAVGKTSGGMRSFCQNNGLPYRWDTRGLPATSGEKK